MFRTGAELAAFLVERDIRQIDLKFTDLFGGLHHISVSTRYMDPRRIDRGIGFDSSSVPGFRTLESGDMVCRPVLSSGYLDPFFDLPTLSFYCDLLEADTLEGFGRDPRSTARRAVDAMCRTGIADASLLGPEFEFHLFDGVSFRNGEGVAHVEVRSGECELPGVDGQATDSALRIPRQKGYLVSPERDRYMNVRSDISERLHQIGIPVKYHHHEVGAAGQSEVEIEMGDLIESADRIQTVKYFVKMLARKAGLAATFMPKPLFGMAGSGMHFHQHLFRAGLPVFHGPDGYAGLSREGLAYIAGVLLHGPALLAFTNPSTNSYKRLVPGFEAPVWLFFSLANRSAAIRIPKYANAPEQKDRKSVV